MTPWNRLELRDVGGPELTGYAATFNDLYPWSDFKEVLRPGAFTRSLADNPRVSLLLNHGRSGSGLPLATTRAGTLTVWEDSVGLAIKARPNPSDPDWQLAESKIKNGDAEEMSFAFRVLGEHGQRWSQDRSLRELLAVDIDNGDVSICDRGANPNTSVQMRAANIGLEVRASGLVTFRGADAAVPVADAEVPGDAQQRPETPAELRVRATTLQSKALEFEFDDLLRQDRKRRGVPAYNSADGLRSATALAREARQRQDWSAVSTWEQAQLAEALAARWLR